MESLAETCERYAMQWMEKLFDPAQPRHLADEFLSMFHACMEMAENAKRQKL